MNDLIENANQDDYCRAVAAVCESGKASTSLVQRQLGIGYNAAARLIERMEAEGFVSRPDHVGKREVLSDTAAISPADVSAWRASGTTGSSASAVVDQLTGGACDGSYPHDEGDFGRCERAMSMIPGLRENLHRMATVNAYWAALAPRWDSILAAEGRTAAIRAVIHPIENVDPSCGRMGAMSMRVGGKVEFTHEQFLAAKKSAAAESHAAGPSHNRTPMKNTPEDKAVSDNVYGVAAAELRQFIEQYEQLESEKQDVAQQQKELMAEAKARGYMTPPLRKIIALRKRDKDDVAEEEAIIEMYKSALGMA